MKPDVEELRKIRDTAAIPTFIAMLKDDRKAVRSNAIHALGNIGIAAVPILIETLQDALPWARSAAAQALGEIGDASAVPALISTLKDEIETVPYYAARALWQIGDSVTLPRKILAASNFSAKERMEILDRLRRVRYYADFGYIPDFRTLGYSFPNIRTLCQMVLKEEDMDARAGAQAVLNWLNGDRALLIPSQRDPDVQVQELVRASQGGVSEIHPESLLIATDTPNETETGH